MSWLFPIAAKLGEFAKQGLDYYVELRAAGMEISPAMISVFLEAKMSDWNPVVRGTAVLDGESKHHAAAFLSRVICNVAGKV